MTKPETISNLIDGYVDGTLTDAENLRLQTLLVSDPSVADTLALACELATFLDEHFHEAAAARSEAESLIASASFDHDLEEGLAAKGPVAQQAPIVPQDRSPILGFLGGVVDYLNHSRMLMFWMIALMSSGWFALQLGSLFIGRAHRPAAEVAAQHADPNSQDVSHPPGGPFANSATPRQRDSVAPMTAAWLTATVDCHWRVVPPAVPPASAPAPAVVKTGADTTAADSSPHENASILEPFHVGSEWEVGQHLDLVHGLAEITFRSGARIILDGPAQFVVASRLGGTLQLGKLTARVPHDASGFAIESPAGKVVDLGTEFGVAVAADHTMEVEVFRGEVAVSSTATGSSGSGSIGVSSKELTAGHAARVVAGQPLVSIAPRPSRFVVGLGPREDPRKARAAYVNWMRSLKPAVWLRMEGEPADRVLRDEMGGPDATLVWDGPGNPFVEGRVDKSLWLRGNPLRDYAVLTTYPQAEHGKLSVSAWVYAESRPERGTIVCNWADSEGIGQFLLTIHRKDAGKGATLFARITQHDGKFVTLSEPDSQPFPLRQWQHVAFTTDGTTFRLYRQGREVGMTKHSGLLYPVRLKMLGIGAKLNDAGTGVSRDGQGCWDGQLDEIAIFNDALSADDIREIAAAPP